MLGCKFLQSSGMGTLADAVKCIDWCTSKNALIQNHSWGGPDFARSLFDAVTRLQNRGGVFIAAAGNARTRSPSYPAAFTHDCVISVASTTVTDSLSDFSNYGTYVLARMCSSTIAF